MSQSDPTRSGTPDEPNIPPASDAVGPTSPYGRPVEPSPYARPGGPEPAAPAPWSPVDADASDPALEATRPYAYGGTTTEPAAGSPGEPAQVWPTTTLDSQPVRPTRGGGRLRWVVALLATVLVVAVGAAVVLLAGRSTPGTALAYLPPDTVLYADARLDFPGDQRERLGDILARFPGFDDQANIETKIDEALDQLFERTGAGYSYTADIKPWFGGELAVGLIEYPETQPAPDFNEDDPFGGFEPAPPRLLAFASVTDRAAAQGMLDELLEKARAEDVPVATRDHRGTTIYTVGETDGEGSPASGVVEFALTDDTMIVGATVGDVAAALDRNVDGGESLGASEAFNDAVERLPADRIGTVYLEGEAYRAQVREQLPDGVPGGALVEHLLANFPDRFVGALTVGSDRIVVETVSRLPEGGARQPVRESGLPARVPEDAMLYVEARDVGANVGALVRALTEDESFAETVGPQFEEIEDLIGTPLEDYLDWLGDSAVFVTVRNDQPVVAIVANTVDEETGRNRLRQLTAFAQQAAGGLGGLEVETDDYGGVEITTIAPSFGALGDPAEGGPPSSVAYAFDQGLFVLGLGDEVVKAVLDQGPEGSLAQNERFSQALEAIGGPATSGITFIDVAALRTAAEAQLNDEMLPIGEEERDRYQQEIKPYLEPFDLFISGTVAAGEDDISRSHLVLVDQE
ncbi:hypothetical protein BH20CHL6_BH20CHL6_02620 [soil metagenome]